MEQKHKVINGGNLWAWVAVGSQGWFVRKTGIPGVLQVKACAQHKGETPACEGKWTDSTARCPLGLAFYSCTAIEEAGPARPPGSEPSPHRLCD